MQLKKINLAVDLMGSETNPINAINACEQFLKNHSDLDLTVIGTKDVLAQINNPKIIKIQAAVEILQTDSVFQARKKQNSSVHLGLSALANKTVDGLVSASNTNVFVSLSYAILGLKKDINKLAFMPFIPTNQKNQTFNLIDVGANLTVSAADLVQFAEMATEFNQKVLNKPNPKVAILNIGTETHKGFSYQQEADQLLKNHPKINYLGFIEPKNLLNYVCDIVVCNGYDGNLVLKTMEGTATVLATVVKNYFKKSWLTKISAFFVYKLLKTMKETFNYKKHAGAIILGLNGLVVKTHGSAGQLEYYSSLELLYKMAKNN
ncbi:Phosphate acyltransferase PlsX-like protein [[Mycoplasma] cavipharyngis]|uniref:phosphate acyltransferase PlsX n=1 Tax=[Mycoplasma] cavipharyngis TaxID=92757 RepID=UPI003704AB98